MARPRSPHPTPAELEILQVIWDGGPSTVRDVMTTLNRTHRRAYTSVMSLMNVMADKGLLTRKPKGRAFLYDARAPREKTLSQLIGDLVNRAFQGSAGAMVCRLIEDTDLSDKELDEIRKTIARQKDV
ncbi:MAG: BlaI/MecI/CopY family transcriptional regulator [Planctomycetes bacterium]|nr:BlaI/MecI/CopY family transcriptional regulator [Planctomycetota bacterium]